MTTTFLIAILLEDARIDEDSAFIEGMYRLYAYWLKKPFCFHEFIIISDLEYKAW